MHEIQRFALNHIYCAPSQDRQYSFSMVKVTQENFPVKRMVQFYNITKHLPDDHNFYHVYVLGNLFPQFLNLTGQSRQWFKDEWVNVAQDMNARNYLLQVYNADGVLYPRECLYYTYIDESSIAIALKVDPGLRRAFAVETFKYLRVYSNDYFHSEEFLSSPVKHGIKVQVQAVANNVDKVALQTKIRQYKQAGGDVFIYVNGYYTDNLNLNIPDHSYVEYVYDQSVLSKETFPIGSLRTFESTKDQKLKYLLYRDKITDRIQYDDDNELYISTPAQLVTQGVFFYEHKDYAARNVTDKDYSLYTAFVNNQANTLAQRTTGAIQDKVLVLYTRKSGTHRPLIYSALKLHELYKLPRDVGLDVLSNTNYTLTELRAEALEDSDYFKLAGAPRLKDVTKELATSAVGYNGVTYYYGYSPATLAPSSAYAEVPKLYHSNSYAYEYDGQGRYLGHHVTSGPMYPTQHPDTKYVEFLKGTTPAHYGALHLPETPIPVRNAEYRVLSAFFDGVNRISDWEDITEHSARVTVQGDSLVCHEPQGKKIRVIYLDEPLTWDAQLPLVDGTLFFPLTVWEDRGTGIQKFPLDLPFSHIEVFLNGRRLTYQLDSFVQLPYINICAKKYLDPDAPTQSVHVRCHGFTLDKTEINQREIRGFVSHGVLTRNSYYDIRDDKVFSVFIDGKLYNRANVRYSEEDNTVRTVHSLNGLPYTLAEPFIPVKEVTGTDTLPLYRSNHELNTRISQLFNLVYQEPPLGDMYTIEHKHALYSPIVSKFIYDMLDGNIDASVYTTPYNDTTILQLLESRYKLLYSLDPVRQSLNHAIVELQPHPLQTTIALNLHQYRFLTNVVRIITQNQPKKIELSGHVTVTTDNSPLPTSPSNQTGGIIVL